MTDFEIDLEKIIRSKGFKLPGFIIERLKKFIHQDFINADLRQGYEGRDFLDHTVEYLDVHPEVTGLENINLPKGTRYTFVSNHPLGGADGIILGSRLWSLFPDEKLSIQVNDFLMAVPNLAPCLIPINKTGAQSRDLPRLLDAQYGSEDQMLVFPAGLCSRRIKGKIQDLPWKKTFIRKSVEKGRYIVPIHFKGENSPRFYRIANLCKFLGFKFNFAMLLLPDELYRAQHKTFEIVVGKPIPPSFFDSSRTPQQWADWVREEVYKL